MNDADSRFTAIVLAGDRGPDDPLLRATGVASKALLAIADRPMLGWVLEALGDSASVGEVHLGGPPANCVEGSDWLRARRDAGAFSWHPPQASPSRSAQRVLEQLPDGPVLLTTADHPLLRAEYVDHFCAAARASGADVVVGLAPYPVVRELFPTMRKTLLRFRDADYCGCNLFAFLSARGRTIATLWREVESARKTPWRVIRLLGWSAVLRYRLGWLSLEEAMRLLSRRCGLTVAAVRMPFGEAAVDVDSLSDHALVEERLRSRAAGASPAA